MKILVVGGGGREHTIIHSLAKSPETPEIFCAPGNGGISKLAKCVDIKATDIDSMVAFAKENNIDLTVVAPDDPLVLGMVDRLKLRAFVPLVQEQMQQSLRAAKFFLKNL